MSENSRQGKKATVYKNRYNAKAYDSLRIVVPKGRKGDIEARAAAVDKSVNGLLNDLLRCDLNMSPAEWKAGVDSADIE